MSEVRGQKGVIKMIEVLEFECTKCGNQLMIAVDKEQTSEELICDNCEEKYIAFFLSLKDDLLEVISVFRDRLKIWDSRGMTSIMELVTEKVTLKGRIVLSNSGSIRAGCQTATICSRRPSINDAMPTTPIGTEEIRDFFEIDLELLAKKDYFDKHFGITKKQPSAES